ncbi:MAG: hypothetical protein IJ410_06780 [Oscillospiraceae bacterium]|nr:hypothetical protein [Oscillospiraceae bacterium]
MLSRRDYIKFSRKLSSMLEDCYLDTKYPNENYKEFEKAYGYKYDEIAFTKGASSLTEHNFYLFVKEKVLQHKDELLEMCANLPKMKTVATDTAGTISYTDLLPETNRTKESFTYSCEEADKFIGLLEINGVGYARDLVGSKEFKAAPIILSPRYKDQVNPDAE